MRLTNSKIILPPHQSSLRRRRPGNFLNQRSSHRRGAAVVEFALVAPVMILLLLGIIEFGRALMVSHLVNAAARAGARKAILESATNSQVEQVVKTHCTSNIGVVTEDITVVIDVNPATATDHPGGDVSGAESGDLCRVSIQIPFDKVSWLGANFLKGKPIVQQCTMQRE